MSAAILTLGGPRSPPIQASWIQRRDGRAAECFGKLLPEVVRNSKPLCGQLAADGTARESKQQHLHNSPVADIYPARETGGSISV